MVKLRRLTFLSDERGAGTVMGLLWFMLLAGVTGMPDETAAATSAVDNSDINMPTGDYELGLRSGNAPGLFTVAYYRLVH